MMSCQRGTYHVTLSKQLFFQDVYQGWHDRMSQGNIPTEWCNISSCTCSYQNTWWTGNLQKFILDIQPESPLDWSFMKQSVRVENENTIEIQSYFLLLKNNFPLYLLFFRLFNFSVSQELRWERVILNGNRGKYSKAFNLQRQCHMVPVRF